MKKKKSLLAVIVLALAANVLAVESPPQSGPMALSIVLDSAWSNEHLMPDYISLSRQVIASLKPGDYLEIVSGHPGNPRLRVAQFIKSGGTQEVRNITSLLQGISCPMLTDVNIAKSVEMALQRLVKSAEKNSFTRAAVIVFTDGKLNDRDVARLEQLAKEFDKRNWSLCITGTYGANRKLLVAANQGKFKFSLVTEANPILWIRSGTVARIAESAPREAPALADSRPTPESGQPQHSFTINSTVSFSDGSEQASESPAAVIPDVKKKEEAAAPAESVTPVIEPELPKEEARAKTVPEPVETSHPQKTSRILVWLIPPLGLLAILAILLSNSLSKAKKWRSSISSRFNTSVQQDPGTLVARLNGQTYSLGRADRINSIHIGSGPKNTIKIPDKSVSDRHVQLYRKGNDFMLRNVGASDIAVNGIPVKPRVKHRLVVPSVIKFNDKTKLDLALLRPKAAGSEKASGEDGAK